MNGNDEQQLKAVFKDEATQRMLNTPTTDPTGAGDENQKFMELVIRLINEGKINLYRPSSLFNESFYESLSDDLKSRADIEAMNLLNAIREMKDLHDAGFKDTYQMENLVERIRITKERIERGGDLFII